MKNGGLKSWQKEIVVDQLLNGIEKRGGDATGIATIKGNGDVFIEKSDIKAPELIKHRTRLDRKAKSILLHTRWATKGHESNLLNNHPIDYENATIIHNGHIRNDDDLFENLDIKRIAEVDSEIIAALFNKYGIEKAHLALQKLEGNFAIAAIDQRNPTALVLAKGKMSPLVYFQTDQFIVWASESKIILDALEKAVYTNQPNYADLKHLGTGDILYIEHGQVEKLEFKVKETPVKPKEPDYWHGRHDHSRNQAGDYVGYGYRHNQHQTDLEREWRGREDTKEIQKEIEEARKAVVPRYGAYKVLRGEGKEAVFYRCCFECGDAKSEVLLVPWEGGWWCNPCLEAEFEWSEEEDVVSDIPEDVNAEILKAFDDEEHEEICKRIGDMTGVSPGMVDFMLFEDEAIIDKEISNKEILRLYEVLATLWDVEMGIRYGDQTEKEESSEKKQEIVLRRGNPMHNNGQMVI